MVNMKKIFFSFLFVIIGFVSQAQSFYDVNVIQEIKIVFSQSNWDYLLDTAIAGKESYLMAQTVTINGIQYDSVGVRYKGNSTYKANQNKNPFHIELDTWKNQDYQGYTDVKLSNVAFDPSFVREVLSYSILRQYMDAPLSNYANVYVNGNLIGLYVSSESISKKFVKNHFYSNNNPFFKCNPVGGAGPGGNAKPNLAYLGTDSSLYYSAYEINSEHGWKELIGLCDTLKNKLGSIEKVLDVDRALWMLAFNNLFVNLDSYSGSFVQNYYLYEDDYQRFSPVVWDLNMSFGTFNMSGTIALQNTLSKQQMTHLLHSGDAGWPLIQKLLSVPTYKRMYIAHMRTMMEENFMNNAYKEAALLYQTTISSSVNADPYKFYSYAQFQSNITNDVSSGMFTAPGLTNLMSGRTTYLNNLADFKSMPPIISNILSSDAEPILYATFYLTAEVTNTNSNAVFLGYRYSVEAPFTKVLMFDDGLHGDGSAGDNVYGAMLEMNALSLQYYIYAENNTAGIFSPVRAEHEFYSLNAKILTIGKGELVINEIMADNQKTITDPSGKYSDWVEMYNNSDFDLSLKNAYLSDSYNKPLKWRFPDEITIMPHSYLIIWASDTTQSGLNASFKLSSSGERIILSYENGYIVDSISFGPQQPDKSFQRCANGIGGFEIGEPSFDGENCKTSSSESLAINEYSIYPNPCSETIFVQTGNTFIENCFIEILDIGGKPIIESFISEDKLDIDISALSGGIYLVKIINTDTKFVTVKKFIKL